MPGPESGGSGPLRSCPACGRPVWEHGFCPGCADYAALCASGRRLLLLAKTVTVTRRPHPRDYCTRWQAVRVRVLTPAGAAEDGLCADHAQELAAMVSAGLVRAWGVPQPWRPGVIARAFYAVFPGAPGGPEATAGRHA